MPKITIERVPPRVLEVTLRIMVHDGDELDFLQHALAESVPVHDLRDLSDYTAEEVASVMHTRPDESFTFEGSLGLLKFRFGKATVAQACWIDHAPYSLPESCASVLAYTRLSNAECFARSLRSYRPEKPSAPRIATRTDAASRRHLHESA